MVAYVNIACYYIVGIPVGAVLGYVFNMGIKVSFPILLLCLESVFSNYSKGSKPEVLYLQVNVKTAYMVV